MMLFFRKLHKWLGLIVALQVIAWMISGLVFALLDHHDVTAQHGTRQPETKFLQPTIPVAEPGSWLPGYGEAAVYEVRLISLLEEWLWRVDTGERVELRRASDGSVVTLNEDMVRELAAEHYAGDGELQSVSFHAEPTIETRDSGAVWQASYDDEQRTTLYFAAQDGQLVETRNATWRLFDFFWMLHTMDYRGRDNFNNPLVITVGFAALWLALSGALLLFTSFTRRDLPRWLRPKPRAAAQ